MMRLVQVSIVVGLATGCFGDNSIDGDRPTITEIVAPRDIDAETTAAVMVHVHGEPDEQLSVGLASMRGVFAPTTKVVITDAGGEATFTSAYTAPVDGVETIVATVTDFRGRSSSETFGISVHGLERIGHAKQFSSTSALSASYLAGQAITVPTRSVLRRVGLISVRAALEVVVGIYSDAAGAPSQLLVQTAIAGPLVVGANEIDISDIALAEGTYWFMANYSATAELYSDATAARVTRGVVTTFGATLPRTMPTTDSSSFPALNYYLVVGKP